jgi:hypothetical protein
MKLVFEQRGDFYTIQKAYANANPKQYVGGKPLDASMARHLINDYLLARACR